MTACDFEFVAHTIAICVVQAVAITIVSFVSVGARAVLVGRICIVVTCRFILATGDFEFITNTVAVHVVQAVALTVIAFFSVRA